MRNTILVFLLLSSPAFAHTTIVANADLSPRSTNPGLKRPPCGNIVRSQNPARHRPGSTIQIDWLEAVQHPGRFEISFSSARDQNFSLLETIPDTQDGEEDLPHHYSTQVTLPDQRCDDCTIQLVQVMTENPAKPRNYYSCADLILAD